MKKIRDYMMLAPVIPVLVLDNPAHARPIAEALVGGGLRALEVTLRTPAALDCIKEMRTVPGAVVGAGTVLNEADLDSALNAGAEFIVSPGLTERLGSAAIERNVPFLPGIANAADLMLGLDLGLNHFKFFPAEANGGIKALSALAGPFGGVRFCPTGGITPGNAPDWLALPSVLSVGGTWLSPKGAPDFAALRALAQSASMLTRVA